MNNYDNKYSDDYAKIQAQLEYNETCAHDTLKRMIQEKKDMEQATSTSRHFTFSFFKFNRKK